MANQEHLRILKKGVEAWNKWRKNHPRIKPDLSNAKLEFTDLVGLDLRCTNLCRANLVNADLHRVALSWANLSGANLESTRLRTADLFDADLGGANLSNSELIGANLRHAELSKASLCGTNLRGANLNSAILKGADFSNAILGFTTFAANDLSKTEGLEAVIHEAPSTIGIDTLYRSGGKIPEVFLRGAGVPDIFIQYLPSLVNAEQAIRFYSCFISYSTKDEEFAKRLHSRLQQDHVRVWFVPEDVRGGRKLEEQIDEAIRVYDKLLVVLSKNSIHSEWVKREIRKARKQEIAEKRRKLFPIRLISYEELNEWECQDSVSGQDLAEEVRQYFIPDFSNWKNHDAFEKAFKRLLRDLQPKAAAKPLKP